MSASATVEFAGTDEELEKYLGEFARLAGGLAARDPRRKEWLLAGGSSLGANPNSLPWKVRVSRTESGLTIAASGTRLPWLRAKGGRIATFRREQIVDFLTTRIRGGGPEKYDADRLRAPFSPFGSGVAALTASFAWSTVCLIGALTGAFVTTTIAGYFLMDGVVDEIAERARIVRESGGLDLPNAGEVASIGFGFKLGCAMLFAFPIAFLTGLLHALALEIGAGSPRASWVSQWSFLTLMFLMALGMWAFLPLLVLVPVALLIPAGAHAGYTLPWAFRRERLREETKPAGRKAIVGFALAAGALILILPRPAAGGEFTDRLVGFRDQWLLGSAPGKAMASFYYRHTLYTADPLKRFYSIRNSEPTRSSRTARVGAVAPLFRERGFTIVPPDVTGTVDVEWDGRTLSSGGARTAWSGPADRTPLPVALDRLADESFRGVWLGEVSSVAYYSLYFGGPIVFTVILIGTLCPAVSLLFRKASRRTALIVLGAVFVVASFSVVLIAGERPPEFSTRDSDAFSKGLTEGSPSVRQTLTFQAYLEARKQPPTRFPAEIGRTLLAAADDPDLRVRLWAVAALGNADLPETLPKLLERLEDPEFFVRYRAAEGLGFLRDPAAIEGLVRVIREGAWYEGLYARQALRKIAPGRF